MTTLSNAALDRRGPSNRILAVTRLLFVNKWSVLYLPGIILVIILLANIAVWGIILNALGPGADANKVREGFGWSGAVFYVFVYLAIIAIQAISRTFPFALGFGVTRREFYLGASIALVLLAAIFAAALTLLAVVEEATGGWGLGGKMFDSNYIAVDGWPQKFLLQFLGFLFFAFAGALFASVYVRWRATGVTILWVAIGIGLLALVPAAPAIFAVQLDRMGVALWSLVPTAVAAIFGYLVLRRAAPRN